MSVHLVYDRSGWSRSRTGWRMNLLTRRLLDSGLCAPTRKARSLRFFERCLFALCLCATAKLRSKGKLKACSSRSYACSTRVQITSNIDIDSTNMCTQQHIELTITTYQNHQHNFTLFCTPVHCDRQICVQRSRVYSDMQRHAGHTYTSVVHLHTHMNQCYFVVGNCRKHPNNALCFTHHHIVDVSTTWL